MWFLKFLRLLDPLENGDLGKATCILVRLERGHKAFLSFTSFSFALEAMTRNSVFNVLGVNLLEVIQFFRLSIVSSKIPNKDGIESAVAVKLVSSAKIEGSAFLRVSGKSLINIRKSSGPRFSCLDSLREQSEWDLLHQ